VGCGSEDEESDGYGEQAERVCDSGHSPTIAP
jgi:hypothetical protein